MDTEEEERVMVREAGPLPLSEDTEAEWGAIARPRSMGSAMGWISGPTAGSIFNSSKKRRFSDRRRLPSFPG